MATLKPVYGSVDGVIITLTDLADAASRQSTEIDNSSDLAIDFLIYCKVKGLAGSVDQINLYVGGQLGDDLRPAGLGASDADFTGEVDELLFIDAIPMNGTTSVEVLLRASIAVGRIAFKKFCLIVENQSGAALSATAGNFDINVQAINFVTV